MRSTDCIESCAIPTLKRSQMLEVLARLEVQGGARRPDHRVHNKIIVGGNMYTYLSNHAPWASDNLTLATCLSPQHIFVLEYLSRNSRHSSCTSWTTIKNWGHCDTIASRVHKSFRRQKLAKAAKRPTRMASVKSRISVSTACCRSKSVSNLAIRIAYYANARRGCWTSG